MKLARQEIKALAQALPDALTTEDLELLAAMLGTSLDSVAPPNAARPLTALKLLQWAQTRNLVPELIVEAREINPTNGALRDLAAGAAVAVEVPASLERAVEGNAAVALLSWEEGLGALEGQICCIEGIPGGGGTGFLVAPDLVMTNHHVVAPVIDGSIAPGAVRLRFDYKKDREGSTVRPGTVVGLHSPDWLLDASPHSAVDLQPRADTLPGTDELDYAVLILNRALGAEPIGQFNRSPPRGWIPFPATAPPLTSGTLVVILQHPEGRPITIAFDTVIGVNDESARTRVRYKVDTENGSSGSPVFDVEWNLVALHHSGDPDYSRNAAYNEGIPIDKIVAMLAVRGHDRRLQPVV